MKEWRTETVRQLCYTIRQTKDYSLLPILADALEEVGYGCDSLENDYLQVMRSDQTNDIDGEKLAAIIFSQETEDAVQFMINNAPKFNMTYGQLISHAKQFTETRESIDQQGDLTWSNEFFDINEEFWKNYSLITGVDTKYDPLWDGHLFTCTC